MLTMILMKSCSVEFHDYYDYVEVHVYFKYVYADCDYDEVHVQLKFMLTDSDEVHLLLSFMLLMLTVILMKSMFN